MKTKNKRKLEKYTLEQILEVIEDIYKVVSHTDDWNVPVVYQSCFISNLKRRLKKIK